MHVTFTPQEHFFFRASVSVTFTEHSLVIFNWKFNFPFFFSANSFEMKQLIKKWFVLLRCLNNWKFCQITKSKANFFQIRKLNWQIFFFDTFSEKKFLAAGVFWKTQCPFFPDWTENMINLLEHDNFQCPRVINFLNTPFIKPKMK